jgi:asparagine synthase (glutamine-hydrolysing)
MCGIAGCYQRADGAVLARAMADHLAHRGPDAAGLHKYEDDRVSVHLAHRRLSIIDLSSAADQPFTKDGLTLTYNGELYNYRELRAELAGQGVRFRTGSDTEVVLEAWRRWGPGALNRFRGMFALALLDERTGHLVLARDPLGIKPLYVARRGSGVVFASELKALLTALPGELGIDHEALVASMLFYWVPEHLCPVAGARRLPAGTWLELRPDGTEVEDTYWRAADVAALAAVDPDPVDLGTVIERSVAAHLVADVPVSTFLSGGLDSSIVTALAARADPALEAYTIGFRSQDRRREAMPDDVAYARTVARFLGIRLHEIELSPDVVAMLPRMVDVLDEPIGDPAAINTLLMCEAARDAGVKVLLSGMGADELFGGYRKHLACVLAARYARLPSPLRTSVRSAVGTLPVAAGGRGLRHVRWAKRFLTFADLPEEEAFRRSYTLYDPAELTDLLHPDLAAHVATVLRQHQDTYADSVLADHVNRMCLADSRMFMPGLNLTYTDRASMAASTEVRVPFVDVEVFSAAFSPSGRDKIHGRHQKVALKRAALQWLPPEVVHRPKASFSAPLRAWVSHDLREVVDDVLLAGRLVRDGLLQGPALHRLVEQDRADRQDRAAQIWQLLTLELWYRRARGESTAT